jgi:hypothetical protein
LNDTKTRNQAQKSTTHWKHAECVTGAAVWTISYALGTINDGTTAVAREVEATDVSCSLSAGEERGDGDNGLHVEQPRTCK